jgi:hypothetical protein
MAPQLTPDQIAQVSVPVSQCLEPIRERDRSAGRCDCLSRRNPQHARWVIYSGPVDVGTGKPNNLDDSKRVRARL